MNKILLPAAAAAGCMFLALSNMPGEAASASYCAAHAGTMASHAAPAGTSAYRRAFRSAYSHCRGPGAGVMNPSYQEQALSASPPPVVAAPEESGSCNFAKYHSSWDPTQCP
ncbi:MAG: hypothetical protein ACJ8AS_05940 [Hyphomicrobiales bacterium]